MKSIAIIKHMYIFDPTDTWQHGSQFEKDLADFFAANGMQADIIETKGNATERVFWIQKIETNAPKLDNKPERSPQQFLASQRANVAPKVTITSTKPFLKGITPTKRGPQPQLKRFSDMKFHPNKEYKK